MKEKYWLTSHDPQAMLTWLQDGNGDLWTGTTVVNRKTSERKLRLFACAVVRGQLIAGGLSVPGIDYDNVAGAVARCELAVDDGVEIPAGDTGWYFNKASAYDAAFGYASQVVGMGYGQISLTEKAALLRDIVGNPFRPVTLPKGDARSCWSCEGKGTHLGAGPDHGNPTCETCNGAGVFAEPCSWLTWRDGTIPALARVIYDKRDWELLPTLADALEEAGCTDTAILAHCRGKEICGFCIGKGRTLENIHIPDPPHMHRMVPKYEKRSQWCHHCHGAGWQDLQCQHCRGCWVLDLLLGRE